MGSSKFCMGPPSLAPSDSIGSGPKPPSRTLQQGFRHNMVALTAYILAAIASSLANAASFGALPPRIGPRLGFGSPRVFDSRQVSTPNVPPECKSDCDPVTAVISGQGGCTPAQCCTTDFEDHIFNCFICVGGGGDVNYDTPQETLDQLVQMCVTAGAPLPRLVFPGEASASPSPSSSIVPQPGASISHSTVLSNPPITNTGIAQTTITNLSPDPTPAQPGAGSGSSGGAPSNSGFRDWVGVVAGLVVVMLGGWA